MHRTLLGLVGWFLVFAAQQLRAAENAALLAALNSITTEDLSRHVDILADDTFEGREAGSRGGRAARTYLTKEIAKFDIKPAGVDGSWYQPYYDNQANILGRLEGSDPELKDQVILVSAHYDHVGYGNSTNSFGPTGFIHNGADDNASGVSGLLEVMQAFQALGTPPRRTILFALWDGEEKGLLGSRYWIDHPTVSLKKLGIAVNMDMIGRLRDKRVDIAGSRTSWGLRKLVSEQMGGEDLLLDFNWELKANSDHWPFFERGIPILMLHTGLHDDYHRPSDDVEKLNKAGMEQVARLLFRITHALADADELGEFRPAARRETPEGRHRMEHPLPPEPPRFGVTWHENPSGPGILLSSVVDGSAADRAGLKSGDRLLKINGEELADGAQLRTLLVSAVSPIQCEIQRAGKPEAETLVVALDGSPTRVGISWREDEAEPKTVLLVRVVPGGPAYEAGLKTNDRLYKLAGEQIEGSRALAEKLAKMEGPVELLVERSGRMNTVTLQLPSLAVTKQNSDGEIPAENPAEATPPGAVDSGTGEKTPSPAEPVESNLP